MKLEKIIKFCEEKLPDNLVQECMEYAKISLDTEPSINQKRFYSSMLLLKYSKYGGLI